MPQYYARIEENRVAAIHLVADAVVEDGGEQAGHELLNALHGGEWVRFSKSGEYRYNKAGIGFTFDPSKGTDGAFIPPKPYPSWVLDEGTCLWEAPTPHPEDGNAYTWDEETTSWVVVPE